MRTAIILCLLISVISCNKNQTKNDNANVSPLFSEYVKTLPQVALPLSISCGIDGAKEIEQAEKFKKFIHTYAERVLGTLPTNGKYNLIIYGRVGDDIYPILYSYDSSGAVIDSLDLIINPCGGADQTQIPHSSAFISKDLTFTLTDTTKLIHYPAGSISVDIYIVDSVRITKIVHQIDSRGHFIVK
ncbi:MAG TPA: hypothetical protein VL443_27335 [Cyclobacteriaceae bacterium]|jgi:hypothetical protein|nr:hypothetical protein [Cyclobacteriaceae bacterium]